MTRRLTILATRQEIQLFTYAVAPPVPTRRWDWIATETGTYDYDAPIGRGCTEVDAVNDLLDELEAR